MPAKPAKPKAQPRPDWVELLQRSRSDPSLTPRNDPRRPGRERRARIIPARKERPRWTSARRWPCTSIGSRKSEPRPGPRRL